MDLNTVTELSRAPRNVGNDPFINSIAAQDPSTPYYTFLNNLVRVMQPTMIVELGVCTGRGTAHFAQGCPSARVIGIDPAPWDVKYITDRYTNITIFKERSDCKRILDSIAPKSVDICFVDTLHEYDLASLETRLWLPKMKSGGVMLFDDITLHPGMVKFWNEIQIPKVSLPHLHWSGFGAAIAP